MKPHLRWLTFFLSCSLLFMACSKEIKNEGSLNNNTNNNNTELPCNLQPVITTNGPVVENERLELHVTNIPESITEFLWTGPNGFTSTEKDPVIENVRALQAGTYTVKITVDAECSATASTDVEIGFLSAPCSPATNTGVLTGYGTLTATSVAIKTTDSSYVMTGTASGGKVEFTFGGSSKPEAGMYKVQPLGGSFVKGDVRIKITAVIYTFTTPSGYLYVGTGEDKVSATFCGLTFSSPSVGSTPLASGNLTEP